MVRNQRKFGQPSGQALPLNVDFCHSMRVLATRCNLQHRHERPHTHTHAQTRRRTDRPLLPCWSISSVLVSVRTTQHPWHSPQAAPSIAHGNSYYYASELDVSSRLLQGISMVTSGCCPRLAPRSFSRQRWRQSHTSNTVRKTQPWQSHACNTMRQPQLWQSPGKQS